MNAATVSQAVILTYFKYQCQALTLFRNILTLLGTVFSPIVWLALSFAALLMYLIVYKMKHFVLYIVNLLHRIS